jgi:hypothetical protein
MLEVASQIASVISAVLAILTSIQALRITRNAATVGTRRSPQPRSGSPRVGRYRIITGVWFVVSIGFVIPTLISGWARERDIWLFPWVLPFLVLSLVLWLIWRRIARA